MFVVAGITGNTGKVVAEALKAEGKRVRALVRNPDHAPALKLQGFDVFVGDLDNPAQLVEALDGAEGAYLLVPPYYGSGILKHQEKVARSIAKALGEVQVPRVVLLSSIGAEVSEGTGPIVTCHVLEEACAELPSLTFLRPAYFMENWLSVLGPAQKDGVLPHFMPNDVAFPMVATRDIGTTAAQLLTQKQRPARIVQLAGPRNMRPNDVASEFSAALEKPIEPLELPLSSFVGTFGEAGVPQELAEIFLEMYQAIHAGRLGFAEQNVRRGSTTVAEVLRAASSAQSAGTAEQKSAAEWRGNEDLRRGGGKSTCPAPPGSVVTGRRGAPKKSAVVGKSVETGFLAQTCSAHRGRAASWRRQPAVLGSRYGASSPSPASRTHLLGLSALLSRGRPRLRQRIGAHAPSRGAAGGGLGRVGKGKPSEHRGSGSIRVFRIRIGGATSKMPRQST